MSHHFWAKLDWFSLGAAYEPGKDLDSNLGVAILLLAIMDYQGVNRLDYEDARDFLYPCDWEAQASLNWAVSLAQGMNAGWLRAGLDRCRAKWD